MERRYWQRKRQAISAIVLISIFVLLTVPFMLIFNFAKATLVIEIIMAAIGMIILISKLSNGIFNRVFIGKEGFSVKKVFRNSFYSWEDVEQCREQIIQDGYSVDICYQVFLKKKDANTPKAILIQKYKNADGELERYIEVESIRKKSEEVKKMPLTIDSWEKATMKIVKSFLGIDAIFLIVIIEGAVTGSNKNFVSGILKWIIIALIVEVMLAFLYLLLRKKKRIEIDRSGISVYMYSQKTSVNWEEVVDVETKNKGNGGAIREYIRFIVKDKESIPFSSLYAEKTKKLERAVEEFYKKENEEF